MDVIMISDFGLAEVSNKRARTLSGGWQRRLSIAMALISDPQILFLGKPTLLQTAVCFIAALFFGLELHI